MKLFDRFWRKQKEKTSKARTPREKEPSQQEARSTTTAELPKPAKDEFAARTAYVLVAPHITEKAAAIGKEYNQYIFRIAKSASKTDVAKAFEALYGIKPVRVETAYIPPKPRRLGRSRGFKSGYKKAVITLPKGKTIETIPR